MPNEPEMEELFKADIATNKLVGFCDAAHANDLRNRRSTTGYTLMLAGGALVYKSKTQPLTACSSTEAEFIAAYDVAKAVRRINLAKIYNCCIYHLLAKLHSIRLKVTLVFLKSFISKENVDLLFRPQALFCSVLPRISV